jgi:hypothetical protein
MSDQGYGRIWSKVEMKITKGKPKKVCAKKSAPLSRKSHEVTWDQI